MEQAMLGMKHIISDIDGVLVGKGDITDEIRQLLLDLQKYVPISLATGRTWEEVQELKLDKLLSNGFFIVENGSEIIQEGKLLVEWDKYIANYLPQLQALQGKLTEHNEVINRRKSFTIVNFAQEQASEDYDTVRIVQNGDSSDFIAKVAGKKNAILYLIEKGLLPSSFAAIGDGDNDLGMLELATHKFTVANASEKVKAVVSNSGYIAKSGNVEGGVEILKLILHELNNSIPH